MRPLKMPCIEPGQTVRTQTRPFLSAVESNGSSLKCYPLRRTLQSEGCPVRWSRRVRYGCDARGRSTRTKNRWQNALNVRAAGLVARRQQRARTVLPSIHGRIPCRDRYACAAVALCSGSLPGLMFWVSSVTPRWHRPPTESRSMLPAAPGCEIGYPKTDNCAATHTGGGAH